MRLLIEKRISRKTNKPYYSIVLYYGYDNKHVILTFDLKTIMRIITIQELAQITVDEPFILFDDE